MQTVIETLSEKKKELFARRDQIQDTYKSNTSSSLAIQNLTSEIQQHDLAINILESFNQILLNNIKP